MFTTIIHLTMNTAMQRPVAPLPERQSARNKPQKPISTPAISKLRRRDRHEPARPPILADSLRIAAGFY